MFARLPFSCFAVAFALAVLIAGMQPTGSAAAPSTIITSAREVRNLGDAELKAERPVRLRGTVLHRYRARRAIILQDESDAIFVSLPRLNEQSGKLPANLIAGAVVEIEGVAAAGHFAPVIKVLRDGDLRVVGTAPLPAPLPLSISAAKTGLLDAHLVVVEGVVRRIRSTATADATAALEMVFEDTRLFVNLDRGEGPSSELVDARIRVTGISGGIWNGQRQIIAPGLRARDQRDITVLRAAPVDPFALPVKSVDDITRYRPEDAPGHRIHLAGVVLHSLPDGQVFVFDGERAVCVECTSPSTVAVGDSVDVAGFPAMREQRSPLLEDAVLRVRNHHSPLPDTAPREAAAILDQSKDYDLVQMDAMLLETQRTKAGIGLLLQSGGKIFKAVLDVPGSDGSLPTLKPGSALSLSGLVLFSFPPPTAQEFRPIDFSLLLRSPADVVVLRAPPWWTSQRMWWLLLGALALIVGALTWAWMLRRRVVAQTILIADGLKHTATLEERTRLAREFHDTLEQELTGLALQIETAQATLPHSPERIGSALTRLGRLARHCVEEAGLAVLDLRCSALETGDLPAALLDASAAAFVGKETGVRFTLEGESRRLPPRIEHALLRVAQEAATNAAKHARAANFEVVLKIETDRITLRLADDGCGFHPETSLAVGQFGLLGMKERIEKISGHFELHSQPGTGTRIEITVPLNSTST